MRTLYLAAAVLLAGCATPRAGDQPRRHHCGPIHFVIEPRLTTTFGFDGSVTPSFAMVLRPVCAPRPTVEAK